MYVYDHQYTDYEVPELISIDVGYGLKEYEVVAKFALSLDLDEYGDVTDFKVDISSDTVILNDGDDDLYFDAKLDHNEIEKIEKAVWSVVDIEWLAEQYRD